MKALAEQYPRYGYLMLHELLRREGLVSNRKRTYRIYSELGMQVRTKRRKRLTRPRVPLATIGFEEVLNHPDVHNTAVLVGEVRTRNPDQ
jgi:transposase InsO family protein